MPAISPLILICPPLNRSAGGGGAPFQSDDFASLVDFVATDLQDCDAGVAEQAEAPGLSGTEEESGAGALTFFGWFPTLGTEAAGDAARTGPRGEEASSVDAAKSRADQGFATPTEDGLEESARRQFLGGADRVNDLQVMSVPLGPPAAQLAPTASGESRPALPLAEEVAAQPAKPAQSKSPLSGEIVLARPSGDAAALPCRSVAADALSPAAPDVLATTARQMPPSEDLGKTEGAGKEEAVSKRTTIVRPARQGGPGASADRGTVAETGDVPARASSFPTPAGPLPTLGDEMQTRADEARQVLPRPQAPVRHEPAPSPPLAVIEIARVGELPKHDAAKVPIDGETDDELGDDGGQVRLRLDPPVAVHSRADAPSSGLVRPREDHAGFVAVVQRQVHADRQFSQPSTSHVTSWPHADWPSPAETSSDEPRLSSASSPDAQLNDMHVFDAAVGDRHGEPASPPGVSGQPSFRPTQVHAPLARAHHATPSPDIEMRDGAAHLTLEGDELGRIDIRVERGDAGIAIVMRAERGESAELMRRNADILHRELAESGIGNARLDFGQGGGPSPGMGGQSGERGTRGRPDGREAIRPENAKQTRKVSDRVDLRL
ncbi:flagellar hook-length control protein FliK [Paracoccus suum]|uniref:Flagellar hook-length control protein FliK n=1 Tax=Paracoccus suum TaxID=2259340 RepID=A0A344PII1_9RHOB|nr:flagellar hook-length control protein FliK [Paracoccus suum]AXC49186.1 flagellar hook-length control protein FliK [Paracoccus suum]